MHVEYFGHVAYMWHLRDIYIASTYMAVAWYIEVYCVAFLAQLCYTYHSFVIVLVDLS